MIASFGRSCVGQIWSISFLQWHKMPSHNHNKTWFFIQVFHIKWNGIDSGYPVVDNDQLKVCIYSIVEMACCLFVSSILRYVSLIYLKCNTVGLCDLLYAHYLIFISSSYLVLHKKTSRMLIFHFVIILHTRPIMTDDKIRNRKSKLFGLRPTKELFRRPDV